MILLRKLEHPILTNSRGECRIMVLYTKLVMVPTSHFLIISCDHMYVTPHIMLVRAIGVDFVAGMILEFHL